jgi:hypothetical protein
MYCSLLCTWPSYFLTSLGGSRGSRGYCPFTDWQWKVKEALGERNLPHNFIEYFAEKLTGQDFDPSLVGILITVGFALAAGLSLYVNFVLPRLRRNPQKA